MISTDYKTITAQKLNERMASDKGTILIHTLTKDHFQSIRLPGAVNACVFEVTFPDQVKQIIKDRKETIVVYGASRDSMDAVTAADKLQRAGYQDIRVLEGGIKDWRALGFALEGSNPDLPDDTGASTPLKNGNYMLDPGESSIEWTGRNPGSKHVGTINLSEGRLTIDGDQSSGRFKIDMNTINNINLKGDELQPVLESHLKSDDFFFTKMFPWAWFHLKKAEPVDHPCYTLPNHTLRGELVLRGVSVPIAFPATLIQTKSNRIIGDAHFDIDRTQWGIIYGSSRFFEHLGMHVVFDLISIQLKIVMVPDQAI